MRKAIVSISKGNSKMGFIPSVSLPPVKTCKNCQTCAKKCYARKLYNLYPSVKTAYDNNLEIATTDRAEYFRQIESTARLTTFFRWHVSGDILDTDYLDRMNKLARTCKGTRFLAFTKNYGVVNDYYANHRKPANLQIVFSMPFDGATIDNPHRFPTANVILKGNEPDKNWKVCGGNCTECACKGVGCWELKKNETIAFYEH